MNEKEPKLKIFEFSSSDKDPASNKRSQRGSVKILNDNAKTDYLPPFLQFSIRPNAKTLHEQQIFEMQCEIANLKKIVEAQGKLIAQIKAK